MASEPFFSVIIPVLDGGAPFRICLDALRACRFRDWELIVVDDGSRDDSPRRAERAGGRVLTTAGRQGPAAARNQGAAAARGKYLLFLDADCEIGPETLERMQAALLAEPRPDAVFGSYDDSPAAPGFIARYKNLLHHWVHQRSQGEVSTFWAGCGAVERDRFLALGGFAEELYRRPSIEDIELGYRLASHGARILLDGTIQVKHHKAWSLRSLLRTDIFDRALPWTELIFDRSQPVRALNLDLRSRLSAVAVLGLTAGLVLAPSYPAALVGATAAAAFLLSANLSFYHFLARRCGVLFALRAIPLHWLYFLYSAGAFAWVWCRRRGGKLRQRWSRDAARRERAG